MSQEWSVVVPVKRLTEAKSRLGADLAPWRSRLAEAFALDTIDAVRDCAVVGAIFVVTDDPTIRAAIGPGATVVPDPRGGDLDAAIRAGACSVPHDLPCAALTADLPALRTVELTEALKAASTLEAAFVADAEGTGTTMLTASSPAALRPRFGPRSADRHRAAGAAALGPNRWHGLRRDVDVASHLTRVRALGTGPRTALVLADLDHTHRYGG